MSKIPEAEVTPPELYFNRRAFMKGGVIAAGAVATGWLYRKLNGVDLVDDEDRRARRARPARPTPATSRTRRRRSYALDHELQQLLRVHDRTRTASRGRAKASSTAGWKVEVGGLVPQAARVRPRRPAQARAARGARLSHALRRGVVDGHPVGRLLAAQAARARRADGRREVRRVRDAARSRRACRARRRACSSGRTSRACGSTRRCIRSRSSRPASTARSCRRRTARRCGWSCRGSTASRASSRSSRSRWSTSSRRRRGTRYAPSEYGFYANVNPDARSPALEPGDRAAHRRDRAAARRCMFNGYADQVASLYAGMDLDAHYLTPFVDGKFAKRFVIACGARAVRCSSCGTRIAASSASTSVNFAIRTTGLVGLVLPDAVARDHAAAPAHRRGTR